MTIGDLRDDLDRTITYRTLSVVIHARLLRCPRSVNIAVGKSMECVKGYHQPPGKPILYSMNGKLCRCARFYKLEYACSV